MSYLTDVVNKNVKTYSLMTPVPHKTTVICVPLMSYLTNVANENVKTYSLMTPVNHKTTVIMCALNELSN